MAITTHGLKSDPEIYALEEGDGFIVTFKGLWFDNVRNHELTQEQRNAVSQAQSEGLLGLQAEVHRDTFAEAVTARNTAEDNWITAMQTFITNFNNNQSDDGST